LTSPLDPLEIAYRYIGARERTVADVEAELARAGVPPMRVVEAVEELRTLGYLDDGRYARLFAADKRLFEQWGSERIARELVRRGIDDELIAAALAGDVTELERAVALIERRFRLPLADRRERERAFGVLRRKGFDSDVAVEALRTVTSPRTQAQRHNAGSARAPDA
jgi:regulatory protein